MTCAARRRRSAVAIAAMVLVLASANLLVLASATASGDLSLLARHRVAALRALYAAESGAAIAVRELDAGREVPLAERTLPGGATIGWSADGTSMPMTLDVVGTSGASTRRLRLWIE